MTFINKTRTQVLELGLRDGSVPFFVFIVNGCGGQRDLGVSVSSGW